MGASTADEYIQQFETLVDESELDEVALIHVFERGLHHSVTKKIYGLEAMPKTLKGWKEYASCFNNQYCHFCALVKDPPNPHHLPRPAASTVPNPTPARAAPSATPAPTQTCSLAMLGPGPMDIDQAHARRCKEFMKKGLCFQCRQSGHVAKDCPQARPVIRVVDAGLSEEGTTAPKGERTSTVDIEAVVRAVLAEMKRVSTDTEKKDF